MYVVFGFISDPDAGLNLPVLIASDHAVYIGVITNVMLAVLSGSSSAAAAPAGSARSSFWGVNLGLAIFAVGLIAESPEIKRIGAPLMGVSLLFALGWLASKAWGREHLDDLDPADLRAAA